MASACQYEEVADKDDLMGVEDTAKKGILPTGPAGGGDGGDGDVGGDICSAVGEDVDGAGGSGDDAGGDVVGSLTMTPCRLLLQTLLEEQEHHLHAGPARGDPEPRRAGGAHPGPSHCPARR